MGARFTKQSAELLLADPRLAAGVLEQGIDETLSCHDFPREHHRSLRTNNMLERIVKELRGRTRG